MCSCPQVKGRDIYSAGSLRKSYLPPHLMTETNLVPETLSFLVFRIHCNSEATIVLLCAK
jgi:hypothetical protein